jgi:2-polyprenyl-6-methoxyphenol hydroxylase-like FAD-dependent oxidoreductase
MQSFFTTTHPPKLQDSFDVVIVGGGMAGCATAYQLSLLAPHLRGAVVERGSLGHNAGGWAMGCPSVADVFCDSSCLTPASIHLLSTLCWFSTF